MKYWRAVPSRYLRGESGQEVLRTSRIGQKPTAAESTLSRIISRHRQGEGIFKLAQVSGTAARS
jgi:hypothetical protein